MKNLVKNYLYPRLNQILFNKILKYKNRKKFLNIVKNPDIKNIAIIDTCPYDSLLIQRPHHLAHYLAKKFDLVIYPTKTDNEINFLSSNLLLSPLSDLEAIKNKNCWIFISSHSCNLTSDEYIYLKKQGFHIVYDYLDCFSQEMFSLNPKIHDVYNNLEKINPDFITTTAKNLYIEMMTRFPSKKIILVENGVNIEDFTNTNKDIIPIDMKPIIENKKPIVGFYGVLASWLDTDLLNKMAYTYPNYNFIYIGHIHAKNFSLEKYDNVFLFGKKPYKELPLYAQHFDCCIIPFKHGETALHTSPVKFFEYMALQKPVVCTRDLVECKGYNGVFVCENDEKFINSISKAIELSKDENIKKELLNQAKINSWENKINLITGNLNF